MNSKECIKSLEGVKLYLESHGQSDLVAEILYVLSYVSDLRSIDTVREYCKMKASDSRQLREESGDSMSEYMWHNMQGEMSAYRDVIKFIDSQKI